MDHLDELRVATASSLPLNGLAPRTYARDHATFEALSNQRGLIADWLVDRLSSSRIPASRARRMTATPAPSGSASLSESLNRVQR
jgi:hypothetical protein